MKMVKSLNRWDVLASASQGETCLLFEKQNWTNAVTMWLDMHFQKNNGKK